MTDEEKLAEEYTQNLPFVFETEVVRRIVKMYAKQAFLAGLKAGRPEWHDLRINPNDLPPLWEGCERSSIRVVDEYDRIISYDYISERWRDYEGDHLGIQPNLWCEIPTFTDKE